MSKALSLDQTLDPKHRASVVARACRIRRRSGDYAPGERLPRLSYFDAVSLVAQDGRLQSARDLAREAGEAANAFMRWARAYSEVRAAREESLTYDQRAAARARSWRAEHPAYHRAYRLKQKRPSGVSGEVWCEIVDACRACCLTCGAPATRIQRLPDGTPAPACFVHEARP